MTRIHRWRWLLLLLGSLLGLLIVPPAAACGCGMYIPREGDTSVPQERALLRWDGQTEDIILSLSIQGSASDAAWVLPVPSRATVQLADPALFTELETLTKPETQIRWGGGGDTGGTGNVGGATVSVLARQTLGPFDVSNLAASDAGALRDWLVANGYRIPTFLDRVLQPYVERGWEYVAVKLVPGDGGALGGELDPLWVRFASTELVYPMRPSAMARQGLSVFLYVLADHRVTTAQSFGMAGTLYANWVTPEELSASPALQALVPQRMFLTKLTEHISNPAGINDDYHFTFAPEDTPYRQVQVVYRSIPALMVLVSLLALLGGAVLVPVVYERVTAWREGRYPLW